MTAFTPYCLACAEAIDVDNDDLAFCSQECQASLVSPSHTTSLASSAATATATATVTATSIPLAAGRGSLSLGGNVDNTNKVISPYYHAYRPPFSSATTTATSIASAPSSTRPPLLPLASSATSNASSSDPSSCNTSSQSTTDSGLVGSSVARRSGSISSASSAGRSSSDGSSKGRSVERRSARDNAHRPAPVVTLPPTRPEGHRRPMLHTRHSTAFAGTQKPRTAQESPSTSPFTFNSITLPLPHYQAQQANAEAIYREHYPKFTARRGNNVSSSNKADPGPTSPYSLGLTRSTQSASGSTPSQLLRNRSNERTLPDEVLLLTPPTLLRSLPPVNVSLPPTPPLNGQEFGTALPPVSAHQHVHFSSNVHSSHYHQRRHGHRSYTVQPTSKLQTSKLSELNSTYSSPYTFRSPFIHIPDRCSAPTRSLDITKATSAARQTSLPPGSTVHSSTVRLSDGSSESGSPTLDAIQPMGAANSLGLEIEHIEQSSSPTLTGGHQPPRQGEIVTTLAPPARGRRLLRTKTMPLPATSSDHTRSSRRNALELYPCDDDDDSGFNSVDSLYRPYMLGEQEASYITKRLFEEQRRRLDKEDRSASPAPKDHHTQQSNEMERRGRSRSRKRERAGSASIAMMV